MVVICPEGGLCNRLRVILSFMEKYNNFDIYWPKTWDICFQDFTDVFKPLSKLNFIEEKPDKFDYKGTSSIGKYSYKLYYQIVPIESIKIRINYFLSKLGKNFYSCHIRRTDHTETQINTKTYISDEVYIYFIKCSPFKVFLATDNIDTQTKFKSIFGDKLITNDAIIETDSVRKSNLENAYIDLVLCSLGKKFLGSSKFSTFSTTINILNKINYWNNIKSL